MIHPPPPKIIRQRKQRKCQFSDDGSIICNKPTTYRGIDIRGTKYGTLEIIDLCDEHAERCKPLIEEKVK